MGDKNSPNDESERVKGERDHLMEGVKAYKMENEKLEKTLQEKDVVTKAMKRSLEHLRKAVNSLRTEERLLVKTNEELVNEVEQLACL